MLTKDDDERPKTHYPEIKIQLKIPEESKESPEKRGLFGSMFGMVKNIFEKEKDTYNDPKVLHEKKNS